MRDLKNKLTSSKNTKNIKNRKGKSFGYQVLGFGAGGGGGPPQVINYLVINLIKLANYPTYLNVQGISINHFI